jgi:arginyl-tRNA synthetase
MWREAREELQAALARRIHEVYGVQHAPVVEVPPRRELGDLAFPAPLHLARELKKPPRAIAQELLAGLQAPPYVRAWQLAGAGYLNVFFARAAAASRLLASPPLPQPDPADPAHREKVIVEHTNINPNKAAHIGHLRNAVLGDVLVATLRALGHPVEVQNYIDDTGVQVADVVVGFLDLRGRTLAEVAAIPEPFDHHCWDLYSEVGRWYEGDPERQKLRRETLHQLERGEGPRAEMGRLVGRRVLARHLATMARLGIGYDLLTHESDILALDFFHQAFDRLKASGAVRLEEAGKNAGCWVMPLAHAEEFAGLEEPDKVIVRSDGTVTYVGKDIAYQLWKFGLLGRDFQYRRWQEQEGRREAGPGSKALWQTCSTGGVAEHPPFGGADRVVNVIDIRQSYLQKIVRAGLEALGHGEQAERSVHFAYEMVALSPATARALGVAVEEGDEGKALEMSGRKGIGVKADDLMDQLVAKAREEIAQRNRELAGDELDALARAIATAHGRPALLHGEGVDEPGDRLRLRRGARLRRRVRAVPAVRRGAVEEHPAAARGRRPAGGAVAGGGSGAAGGSLAGRPVGAGGAGGAAGRHGREGRQDARAVAAGAARARPRPGLQRRVPQAPDPAGARRRQAWRPPGGDPGVRARAGGGLRAARDPAAGADVGCDS